MSNYSGTATITFSIERYREDDGTFRPVKPDDEEYELMDLLVQGNAYFTAGKYYGEPESCYPDEGDVGIESILCRGKSFSQDDLTEDEREGVLEAINEAVKNNDDFIEPEPDYDDGDY